LKKALVGFFSVGNGKRGLPFFSISKDVEVLENGGPSLDRTLEDRMQVSKSGVFRWPVKLSQAPVNGRFLSVFKGRFRSWSSMVLKSWFNS
jgi:hypothetical protein